MANITINSPQSDWKGRISLTEFVNGEATVDDTTAEGATVIAFARRQGWKVGAGAATVESVADGKPLSRWTKPELVAYLTDKKVQFPDTATVPELRALVQDAYNNKAAGGSAVNESAGQTSGSSIVLDGQPSRFDNATENAKYSQGVTPSGEFTDPTITTQPQSAEVALGDAHTFTVVATGVPAVEYEWQHKGTAEDAEFETIDGETDDSLTIADVQEAQLGSYRVIVSNAQGETVSAPAELTTETSAS